MKISRNPQIAYNQGRAEGYEVGYAAGYKEGGETCVDVARHFAALALYNITHNFVKSEKKQRELVLAFCEEQNRLYGDEFYNNTDNVLIAKNAVEKIYKEIGFLQKEGEVDG